MTVTKGGFIDGDVQGRGDQLQIAAQGVQGSQGGRFFPDQQADRAQVGQASPGTQTQAEALGVRRPRRQFQQEPDAVNRDQVVRVVQQRSAQRDPAQQGVGVQAQRIAQFGVAKERGAANDW